jgi:hypothetical protein
VTRKPSPAAVASHKKACPFSGGQVKLLTRPAVKAIFAMLKPFSYIAQDVTADVREFSKNKRISINTYGQKMNLSR